MTEDWRVIAHVLGLLSLLIWLYLLLARGGFWRMPRASRAPPTASQPPGSTPSARSVVAIIPARDEAPVIGDTVESILRQSYPGRLHLILVDDGSSDGTAEAAMAAASRLQGQRRLTIVKGTPPPPGWTGKLWAMSQGVAAAAALEPDYLLFTDADIHHEASNLESLVLRAESRDRDLVSYMVQLSVATFAEKLLIPAFVFFFFQLYPPAWIASSRSAVAGAAGGCMLMRPAALTRIGGIAVIRSQLIDDCALARAVKSAGGSVWLEPSHNARSTRVYASLGAIGGMISRSAFNQLRHSYALLAATLVGLGVTYLVPPLLLLSGDWPSMTLGAAAWAIMSACYAPTIRFYRLAPLWSVCLPVIAIFYGAATAHSALQFRLRRGGLWKGRVQDLRS
jgi:hopene-associated glycosyltransferase HpnB